MSSCIVNTLLIDRKRVKGLLDVLMGVSLAQLAERTAVNREVVGSNPTGGE